MAGFTATAAAIGVASTAAGSGMSFAQANKQRRMQRDAEEAASRAITAARKKLEVNVYDAIGIQKTPYELEREAMLSAGAQATEAGRESERGAAATAGRIYAGQQAGQADIQTRMGQEMLGLEKLSAQEQSRLRDIGVNLDMMEAQGAQMAAAQAEERAAQATQQGIEGAISTVQQGIEFIPLYQKTKQARAYNKMLKQAGKANMNPADLQQKIQEATGQTFKNPMEMQSYVTSLPMEQINQLYSSVFAPQPLPPIDPNTLPGPVANQQLGLPSNPFDLYGKGF